MFSSNSQLVGTLVFEPSFRLAGRSKQLTLPSPLLPIQPHEIFPNKWIQTLFPIRLFLRGGRLTFFLSLATKCPINLPPLGQTYWCSKSEVKYTISMQDQLAWMGRTYTITLDWWCTVASNFCTPIYVLLGMRFHQKQPCLELNRVGLGVAKTLADRGEFSIMGPQ